VRTGPELEVSVGDGRIGLARQSTGAFDIVVGDAFGHLVVPWHLTTRELVEDVRRTLRPHGIYALNVIDYPPNRFVRAEVATVAAVFPHVALAAPPDAPQSEHGSNFVLLASDAPLPLDALRRQLSADSEPVTLTAGQELASFTDGARVLTDDHAPVDQLLAR
jgi:spermidine synthase